MRSDFWVVVATAAPVVVLSCIVLCSTQSGNLAELIHEPKTKKRWAILWFIVIAAILNLAVFAIEGFTFLVALRHLELGTDGEHGRVALGQMWCLFGLGVSSVITHVARCSWWNGSQAAQD
jgi:predicted MFS family arabinose efflux permease